MGFPPRNGAARYGAKDNLARYYLQSDSPPGAYRQFLQTDRMWVHGSLGRRGFPARMSAVTTLSPPVFDTTGTLAAHMFGARKGERDVT
jgi:hypothetical protein